MKNPPPNIVVIGFMGAGKSTVARALGERLGRNSVEMDHRIAMQSGYPSVAALIDSLGEKAFRDIETKVAEDLSQEAGIVISTGGGVVTREENMLALGSAGAVVVYLSTDFSTLEERIKKDIDPSNSRPLFRDPDTARELYLTRQTMYTRWATVTVKTDTLSPSEIVDFIVEQLP